MIIESLLDLDVYKLYMMQLAYLNHRNVKVEYAFKNRTSSIKLSSIIDEDMLVSELDNIKKLKFNDEEIEWVSKQTHIYEHDSKNVVKTFKPEFIEYLRNFELSDYTLGFDSDGEYDIRTKGNWSDAILWETMILSTVNELYYINKYQERSSFISNGTSNLFSYITTLMKYTDLPFIDFGTRRRFSKDWQKNVVDVLNSSIPKTSFLGTSNCKLSMDLNINVSGTNAHEMYMIATGIWRDDMREAHSKILDEWYDLYGYDMSIALTDTFGTDYFFTDFGEDRAKKWRGVRQDSGNPFEFGEKVIKFYESYNIDPKSKIIIFSDGLSIDKMIKLYERFDGRIKIGFGWGTKLSNNVGVETLSIVMKAVKVISVGDVKLNNWLVKLSDNLNKAMGPDKEIELYKNIFEYTNTDSEVLEV